MPAPPPESEPAMVSAVGMLLLFIPCRLRGCLGPHNESGLTTRAPCVRLPCLPIRGSRLLARGSLRPIQSCVLLVASQDPFHVIPGLGVRDVLGEFFLGREAEALNP